jgi:hypothetical protein
MTSMASADTATEVAQVESEEDLRQVRLLFREFAASLNVTFQGFEKESAELPGD